MNLADLLTAQADATPRNTAAIHGDRTHTHASLEAAAWGMTGHLADAGLKPGDVVGLRIQDPLLHLIVAFALARMGVVYLATSTDANATQQNEQLLARIRATAVVGDQTPTTGGRRLIGLEPDLAFTCASRPIPTLRHDRPNWPLMFKSSSGTTGTPKIIGATHEGMIASIAREQTAPGYMHDERYLSPMALHFDAPKRRYIACIVSGSTAVMPPRDRTWEAFSALIDRHDVRNFSCVPRFAHDIIQVVPPGRQRFPHMRCFRLSAAPSDGSLHRLLRERVCSNIVVSYGCSELGPMTIAGTQMLERSPTTVGQPMRGVAVEVVSDAHQPVAAGATGIVRVRAEGMPLAYHDDPEATQQHFRDGWFYPGDLGALSADGALTLMGRADDVMIFEGVNIAPLEIEQVLLSHPNVREAAAFPMSSKQSHQLPAAAVVLDQDIDMNGLNEFAKDRLGIRAPVVIVRVNEMPRNQGGKILKRELADAVIRQLAARTSRPA